MACRCADVPIWGAAGLPRWRWLSPENTLGSSPMKHSFDRYEGKPFLRLLDSYVLDAIDQLTERQREGLVLMEPKLQAVYKSTGHWQEIVRTQMNFPPSLPQTIRKMWDGYMSAARSQGLPALPQEFVVRFVDENFPEVHS